MLKVICLLTTAAFLGAEEKSEDGPRFLSPDKKWEYRVIGDAGALVSAGSTTPAVAFEGGSLQTETAKLLWAPDSRRFALNYRSGGKYYAFDVYELAGTEWKQLPSVIEKASAVDRLIERALARDRKRIRSKKGTSNSVMTIWKVLRWIDNDTFEVYASEQRRVHGLKADEFEDDWEYFGCAVSFRVKCDNRGGWKVVASHELSEAENDKLFKDND